MIIAAGHEGTLKPALKSINLSSHGYPGDHNLPFCMNLAIERTDAACSKAVVWVGKGKSTMKPARMKRFEMKREDLARVLAERGRLSQGEAQDELDRLVHGIVRSLRRGRAAEM